MREDGSAESWSGAIVPGDELVVGPSKERKVELGLGCRSPGLASGK